jgi:hypothetical protein
MKIKQFLKNNKIYFETIVIFILTLSLLITSIMMSIQANNIAEQANKITNIQVDIMKAQYQPFLNFIIEPIYDFNKSYYAQEKLIIINEGSPIRNFKSTSIICFEFYNWIENKTYSKFRIPAFGFYDTTFDTYNQTGILEESICTQIEEGNRYKIFNITQQFPDYALAKNDNIIHVMIEFKRYILVEYQNMLGEDFQDLYYVDDFGSHALSGQEKESIYNQYTDTELTLNFSLLTVESLYEKWLSLEDSV